MGIEKIAHTRNNHSGLVLQHVVAGVIEDQALRVRQALFESTKEMRIDFTGFLYHFQLQLATGRRHLGRAYTIIFVPGLMYTFASSSHRGCTSSFAAVSIHPA